VIDKHREDVLLDLFRGSTGERVLRFGTRPFLVVKERPSVPYVSVLAAVDFSPPCRKALEFAFGLVPDGQFQLVHAFDIPFRGLLVEGRSFGELTKKHQRQFDDMVKEDHTDHPPPGISSRICGNVMKASLGPAAGKTAGNMARPATSANSVSPATTTAADPGIFVSRPR